jgi:hypothetical protein
MAERKPIYMCKHIERGKICMKYSQVLDKGGNRSDLPPGIKVENGMCTVAHLSPPQQKAACSQFEEGPERTVWDILQ